jgi:hypothetical protein
MRAARENSVCHKRTGSKLTLPAPAAERGFG